MAPSGIDVGRCLQKWNDLLHVECSNLLHVEYELTDWLVQLLLYFDSLCVRFSVLRNCVLDKSYYVFLTFLMNKYYCSNSLHSVNVRPARRILRYLGNSVHVFRMY